MYSGTAPCPTVLRAKLILIQSIAKEFECRFAQIRNWVTLNEWRVTIRSFRLLTTNESEKKLSESDLQMIESNIHLAAAQRLVQY